MSSIRAYIRTQSKSKVNVKIRFLLIDKKVNLSYVSELLVNPDYWDSAKQGYSNSKQITDNQRNELDANIQKIKYFILDIYNKEFAKGNLSSNRLTELVNQKLNSITPESKPKSKRESKPRKIENKPVLKSETEVTLLDAIDFTLSRNDITYKRQQTYLVVRHSIERFIYYKSKHNKQFTITLKNTNVDLLWDLEKFFTDEPDLLNINSKIKSIFPKYQKPTIRSRNTVIGFMRVLRAVFNFCIKHEMTQNYPFRKYKMKEQVFGTPFYPTTAELKKLYNFNFNNKTLNEQRDIFIFQCQVGMRINDLYLLTNSNINNGILQYIPTKTKRFRVKTISIPLNSVALEILERYSENEQLLPFISQQKYNQYLKKIFTLAGLRRSVTMIDPQTNKEVVKRLNEIIHSHAARKYFCANLFEQVKDQSIVAELSGHSPSSISFQRYRNISNELKKSLTDNLF